MSHQYLIWTLQACWDAVVALGPIAALAFLTWRVTR
jgi:hypothetical protein